MAVDPGLGIGRQERGLELAGRQGHPLIDATQPVTIHIHIVELVIGPNLLQLSVRIHQRLPVPQPNVVNGRLVGLERLEGKALFHREGFDRDLMEIIRLLGEVDVPLDVGLLQLQLVGFHEHELKHRGERQSQHQRAPEDQHHPR
jgi:hypothetical protein